MRSLFRILLVLTVFFVSSGSLCAQTPSSDNASKTKKERRKKQAEPQRDPKLAGFGIYAESAPEPSRASPVETKLPLELRPNERIAFVGNTLFDRMQHFGYFESFLYQTHPDLNLVIRNFAWSADEVDLQPRPDNFATVKQHLAREKIDVVFAAFGFNESFAGVDRIGEFKARLTTYLIDLGTSAFNGETGPRIVLLTPAANENIIGVPAADLNNKRLDSYTQAMAEVAVEQHVGFANIFDATRGAMVDEKSDLTINGVHLNDEGYRQFAAQLFSTVFNKSAPPINDELRKVVLDKNRQYFRRYRPLNTFYYTGGRRGKYGYLDFLPAMRNFEIMTANRESRIHSMARGDLDLKPVDDSNVPPLNEVTASRGANEWLGPADELAAFDIDPRFEVSLFASEEQFPEMACPIQMRWDAKGRLWVSCSTTYPHVYPGREPDDKIVILEDTDHDGRADKCTTFADDVHIPLSFALVKNGCYVSEEPHLSLLLDTDSDGRADSREHVLTGFGCEDSHHALHDFVWTPDGDLLFRESIFHNSQVETPYGPVRAKNSAWFRFRPDNQRLISFGAYPNTNPWGVTFTDWGHHIASHPIFASAFHATNPPYPKQHARAAGIPAYSGVCGHEFVDFPNWPEEFQGGMVKVRYKPTNRVEFHSWTEQEDHYAEKRRFDILFSRNLSFIPVDCRFGPRGAMYVCDWYNPVKGHAQYSLRDPRRDRKSGRIWRITPKNFKPQTPPHIAEASVAELLENLKRREYRYRYWSKRELRGRDQGELERTLDHWVANLNPEDPRHRHNQIEAVWLYRALGTVRPALLAELLDCGDAHARAAATRQLRYWHHALANDGVGHLRDRANDPNGIVRLEAANAASHIGTPEALEAILDILNHPLDGLTHLSYALRCSLESENLARHWRDNEDFLAEHPALVGFSNRWDKKSKIAFVGETEGKEQRAKNKAFDALEDLATVRIRCLPERMLYSRNRFKVKPGQPVKLVFTNPDATQHNLVLVEPDALEEIGMAGNEMAKDPDGLRKGFLPESEKIIVHTELLEPATGQVLRFHAPEKPGTYPYLCTFPGHWIVMKGECVVEE